MQKLRQRLLHRQRPAQEPPQAKNVAASGKTTPGPATESAPAHPGKTPLQRLKNAAPSLSISPVRTILGGRQSKRDAQARASFRQEIAKFSVNLQRERELIREAYADRPSKLEANEVRLDRLLLEKIQELFALLSEDEVEAHRRMPGMASVFDLYDNPPVVSSNEPMIGEPKVMYVFRMGVEGAEITSQELPEELEHIRRDLPRIPVNAQDPREREPDVVYAMRIAAAHPELDAQQLARAVYGWVVPENLRAAHRQSPRRLGESWTEHAVRLHQTYSELNGSHLVALTGMTEDVLRAHPDLTAMFPPKAPFAAESARHLLKYSEIRLAMDMLGCACPEGSAEQRTALAFKPRLAQAQATFETWKTIRNTLPAFGPEVHAALDDPSSLMSRAMADFKALNESISADIEDAALHPDDYNTLYSILNAMYTQLPETQHG